MKNFMQNMNNLTEILNVIRKCYLKKWKLLICCVNSAFKIEKKNLKEIPKMKVNLKMKNLMKVLKQENLKKLINKP